MIYIGRIPFRPEMVRSVIDDIKTETRREAWRPVTQGSGKGVAVKPSKWQKLKPGDLLWVTESYRPNDLFPEDWSWIIYRADVSPGALGPWKPGMFLPRHASRLTIEVIATKVERLQSISEEAAKAEGVYRVDPTKEEIESGDCTADDFVWMAPGTRQGFGLTKEQRNREKWGPDPVFAFRCVWEGINGRGSWATNPEVVAIRFKRHLQNIDALLSERAAA